MERNLSENILVVVVRESFFFKCRKCSSWEANDERASLWERMKNIAGRENRGQESIRTFQAGRRAMENGLREGSVWCPWGKDGPLQMHMVIRGRTGGDEARQMSRNHLGQKMGGREQHLLLDESKRNKREKLRSLGRQRFKKIFLSRDQSYSQRFLLCTHPAKT